MIVCEVFRQLSQSCTTAHEDASSFFFDGVEPRGERASTVAATGDGIHHRYVAPFTKAFDRVIELRASTAVASTTARFHPQSMESVLGVHLALSSRRDYRACVDFVTSGSVAESLGIQPGALVVSVNGVSMRGLVVDQVEEAIHHAIDTTGKPDAMSTEITIEFSQRVDEVKVDSNPFQMTSFPSPVGQHLPGFQQFSESERETESTTHGADHPPTQRRRERSRSMKHFWMSDRSSKACYDCERLFTFFRRRHHCRSCGQIFCSQCCARLPQSFGGTKVDESISRLRKQLVCHTCHRQLREGLEVELAGGHLIQAGDRVPENSPVSQTLLLMPPQIAEALERSSSVDATQYKNLDKRELFDKDEMSNDAVTEQVEKSRPTALFSMFPKVQIVASVQQLTHQPRLQGVSMDKSIAHHGRRPRSYSLPLELIDGKDSRKQDLVRSYNKMKRCNSRSEIGNPSCHRWSESEFKRLVEESNAVARAEGVVSTPRSKLIRSRPKALSGTFGDSQGFGSTVKRDPFALRSQTSSNKSSSTKPSAFAGATPSTDTVNDRPSVSSSTSRESGVLRMIGLAEDARDDSEDSASLERREQSLRSMGDHGRTRIEERIFHLLESSPALARLNIMEQHKWMQIINMFAVRAATTVNCHPDQGDSMDIMDYVRIKCLDGGRVQDSFFIDGVLVHKSMARKGMRCDIENPRILLIASELDYQRKKEAISSLESVAGQEVEYMHIVAEKIMTMHPDIVMFSGHVHRVAEELLFKEGIAVIKNVRMVDLQRIARSTGASLLTSYDHVDKISDKAVIGTCKRFYVMLSDYEPRSARRFDIHKGANGQYNVREEGSEMRKKRPQRQNIVFEGGITSRGCTICLRGGTPAVFDAVTKALTIIARTAYNMRMQRHLLVEYGYLPPVEEADRSVAEEWFAKCSTSLYISLKSNSLSMRAALKETQSMCKWCKDHTRYNNISSLRVLRSDRDEGDTRRPVEATWGGADGSLITMTSDSGCTCNSRSSDALRDRILFTTCWSSLEGKTASKAEMMCIDFYSTNDCSVGQFLDKYCFAASDREFKRAFQTSQLSFSHDVGRLTFRVKDLTEIKDPSDRQMPAAELLRDLSHRVVLRMIRSDRVFMWSRNVDADAGSRLASRYAPVPVDVWNYSFGKFLEDMFYGKAMEIDSIRFPHLSSVRNSRDSALVHYFSRRGRVVSIQFEPVEPVLHVALQPVLWQDHIDHQQQQSAIQELCELAGEVYATTISMLTESMADPVTPLHAKAKLRILRNEVQQWHSCYASKVERDPPHDIFTKNARFKEIYKHAADWSMRITQSMHATVKPTLLLAEHSPKSTLPRAWFDQIAGAMERETGSSTLGGTSTSSDLPPIIQFQETVTEMAGNLENLARFARSLATGEVSGPSGFSNIANEVANTLNTSTLRNGTSVTSGTGGTPGMTTIESSDATSDREDHISQSYPPNESSETSSSFYANNVGASTFGSYSSRLALEAFRRSHQSKKTDQRGYLKIPKRLLDWHPNLPAGVKDTVILVNASQPTSVVAFSLCSDEYTEKVNGYIRKESINLEGPMNSVEAQVTCSSTEAAMLRMLRSTRRNNVDHVFVDDNQFQQATRFSCKSYYAMQFHALRRLYYGGDRNYVESLCHCEQWNAAGGKSGAGFLKTRDQRFIAKAIPEIELQMFLSMANEYFGYMAKTFENNLSSMLSKVLGIYKVTISSETDQKMCIIVMENLIYGRDVNFSFDLKGKMEGRYRERSDKDKQSGGQVLWDRNFVEMAGGIPLPLQESAMSLLLSAIANDTAFLASVQATDYSMLVGYDVRKQEVVASIIDYIHKYDFLKMVEHAGKRLIQDAGEITVLNPRQYRKRFCLSMTKYFMTIPSRYTKVTTLNRSLKEAAEDDGSVGSATLTAVPPLAASSSASVGDHPTPPVTGASSSASSSVSSGATVAALMMQHYRRAGRMESTDTIPASTGSNASTISNASTVSNGYK